MKQITDKSIYLWVLKWLPVIGTALIASHLCDAALRLQVVHYRLHHGRLVVCLDIPVFRKQAVLLQATQSLLHLYRCCIS